MHYHVAPCSSVALIQGLLERSWLVGVLPLEILTSYILSQFMVIVMQVREDPLRKMPGLFGHCPNSDCPPPPSLKRALWGTLFPDRLEQMPFELQFSLHKCPKPSWQGFRPPKPSKCPFEHGQFFPASFSVGLPSVLK